MVTVYGFAASGNCWKITTILRLTGRAYRWVDVNSNAGETRTPAFLARDPNGKVPVVALEDGQHISESCAILCHFARARPGCRHRACPAHGCWNGCSSSSMATSSTSRWPATSSPT